jgi:ATP phosphoribosyltransferase
MDGDRLRLAMQRSGRLSDASFELLSKCGLHISRSRTELFCRIEELPIDLLLVRDDDIPGRRGRLIMSVKCGEALRRQRRLQDRHHLPLGYRRLSWRCRRDGRSRISAT